MWKALQKKISKLPWWSTNPICIAGVLFVVWMIFFDNNNVMSQLHKHQELSAMLEKKNFYLLQIKETNKQYAELNSNPASQEKFAREHYWMKRDNEDIFVIVEEK